MPKSPRHTIPVASTVKIFDAAAAAGDSKQQVCEAAGIDICTLVDGEALMPFRQLVALYNAAAELTGDETFGLHVGERDDPKLYGILGYVSINSGTVGDAFERLVRFQEIRSAASLFTLTVAEKEARLAYVYQSSDLTPEFRRHEAEETLSSMTKFARQITATEWVARSVHFEHSAPASLTEHERIFRTSLLFDQPATELVFDRAFLDLRLVDADVTLGALLESQAEQLLGRSTSTDSELIQAARKAITDGIGRERATLRSVARQLGVSSRTLQRRMSDAGYSFQQLEVDVQLKLATGYLGEPRLSIAEISAMLGFSEPSAFHRAFRRWTGVTPRKYRARK